MKKIMISLGVLLSILSMDLMAATSEKSFTERTVRQDTSLYTVYEVKLNAEQTLAFFMNHKDTTATARLLNNTGKSYRVLSVRYCEAETDNCWTNVLYNDSMEDFVNQLESYRKKYDLVWSIDYIAGNDLENTELSPAPQIGALSVYADVDEMEEGIPYLVWDKEPANYQ